MATKSMAILITLYNPQMANACKAVNMYMKLKINGSIVC
jgi:hypothetical protein